MEIIWGIRIYQNAQDRDTLITSPLWDHQEQISKGGLDPAGMIRYKDYWRTDKTRVQTSSEPRYTGLQRYSGGRSFPQVSNQMLTDLTGIIFRPMNIC